MAVAYPVGLPWYAERGTLQDSSQRNINSFQPDNGMPLESRKSSFKSITLSFAFYVSNAEVDTLQNWYRDNLGDGVLIFGPAPHPRTGVMMNFKFIDEPQYNDAGFDNNRVSVKVRTLP